MNLDWSNWLYGLFAGSLSGAANAASGAISAAVVDSGHFSFGSLASLKLMVAIFAFTFMKDAMLYLSQKPLPPIKTVTTTSTVEQKVHPTETVTTTVQETKLTDSEK